MMLRREIMREKKPERQEEIIVFKYLLSQREFHQYMKKYLPKSLRNL